MGLTGEKLFGKKFSPPHPLFKNALRKDPAAKISVIAHDASDAFCECENCKKLGTYNGKFSISDLSYKDKPGVFYGKYG